MGEQEGDTAPSIEGGSEDASKRPLANVNSGSATGGPLQMTNVQVELAQEIALYMKATRGDTDQVWP